ncbi:hypothetical protein VU07_03520 [Desulfobulbus sp. F4]|nr:hypothetical protein [Desulfobulbus sp. F4]
MKYVFLERGAESSHVHFLVQSAPACSPTMTAMRIKSLTAGEIFSKVPSVEKQL